MTKSLRIGRRMVPQTGLEPVPPSLRMPCSTTELLRRTTSKRFHEASGSLARNRSVRPKTPAPDIGQRLAWQEKRWRPIPLRGGKGRPAQPISLFGRDVFESTADAGEKATPSPGLAGR